MSEDAPEQPCEWQDVLKDFTEKILPGVSTNILWCMLYVMKIRI